LRELKASQDVAMEGESEQFQRLVCFCRHTRYHVFLAGDHDRLLLRDYEFKIAECLECGLARTFPVPDTSQYERGYFVTTGLHGEFTGGYEDAWSADIARFVRSRSSGVKLLDVGCNVGNLVAAAAQEGFAAEGIDIDPVAIRAGRSRGRNVRLMRIEDVEGSVDAVVLNHVLEHVLELRGFLSAVERTLVPGGRMFVFVPHYRGLIPRLMRKNWIGWFPSQHIWHFTPKTLEHVIAEASELRLIELTTKGAIEPPSTGVKVRAKQLATWIAQRMCWGDQIEAIFEKPRPEERRDGD
jgi:2-polyprenyl-3-methyl-5-hydroxy-6-metoxy-1,4-benzoquinol methylase